VYRQAPPAQETPKEVVRYRSTGPVATVLLVVLVATFATVLAFQSFLNLRSVRLECTRGAAGDLCDRLVALGPIVTHDRIPIASITSVALESHAQKSGTKYTVVLATTEGRSVLSWREQPFASAHEKEAAIRAFLIDARAPSLALTIDEPQPFTSLFMGLFSLGLASIVAVLLVSARLEFDFDRRVIRYTRVRWPLRPIRRTLRGEEIARATVHAKPGSKGGTVYQVALVLADGGDLPLVGGSSGGEKHHERTAQRINALLDRMKERDDA
jgi:hypothetical protein